MSNRALVTAGHAITDAQDRQVGPGKEIPNFDPAHPHNVELLEAGLVAMLGPPAVLTGESLQERAVELDIKGRSQMTADELREAIAEAEATTNSQEE